MAQIIIDTGAAANDGTGDPLRTAFTDTNLNFTAIWNQGPVNSNVKIANNTILTLNTNGNLVLAPNGTGKVVANVDIVPDTANIRNLGSTAKRWSTLYTQYLDVSASTAFSGNLTVGGNLTVSGNIIEMGNIVTDALTIQLANTAANTGSANGAGVTVGANDNIATLLYNSTGNVWTTNIGISAVGNITAPYFIGNGSQLTGLPDSYGNANVATFLANFGSNTISTTGNVTMGNILPAGYVSATGNVRGANLNTVGAVSATGNVTGNYFIGDGSQLTSLPAPTVTQDITSNGAMSIMTYDGVIKYVNYATVEPSSGNITGGNISTTGNVTGNYFIGDGSQLTGISTANIGDITFVNTTISAPNDDDINIQALNNDGVVSSAIFMRPGDTYTRLEQWGSQDSTSFTTADWATGVYTTQGGGSIGAVEFTGATNIINFVNSLVGVGQIYFSINGGPLLSWDGTSSGGGNITFYTPTLPATDPTTVTSFEYYYSYYSQIEIDYDAEEFNIEANNVDLTLSTTNQKDIDLNSSRDMTLIANGTYSLTNYDSTEGLYITTDANDGLYQWNFDVTGNLILPRGGIVYETNIPFGGLSGNTIALAPSGGTNADQQLLVYPTAGPDANHLHLTSGNLYNTELFLGDDNLYVKLANTGDIIINSNDGVGNTAQWTFDYTGGLELATVSNESAKFVGTRKVVGGLTATSPYSVTLSAGGTPTVAYTSLSGTQSVKVCFAVASNGAGFQWEQFDVVAVPSQDVGGAVNFVVSNRVKGAASIPDTVVTATMSSGQIQISLTLDATQTSGGTATFDAVEFGLMVD